MKVLQISGSGRDSGKTTFGCAVIAAFPSLRWAAVKVTLHTFHDEFHAGPVSVALPVPLRKDSKDTDRFLDAGAVEAHLRNAPLTTSFLSSYADRADVVLIESGQTLSGLRWPLLRLVIAPPDAALWKPGFVDRLMEADVLVLTGASVPAAASVIPSGLCVFSQPDPAALAASLHPCLATFFYSVDAS